MAHHWVEVRQLVSEYGDAFLNVKTDIFGGIAVWSGTLLPTFLLHNEKRHLVWLVQFTDEEVAEEWLAEHKDEFSTVTRLEDST